jgi:hypothetical protein
MGKQKTVGILLAVLFLMSLTAAAVSAGACSCNKCGCDKCKSCCCTEAPDTTVSDIAKWFFGSGWGCGFGGSSSGLGLADFYDGNAAFKTTSSEIIPIADA